MTSSKPTCASVCSVRYAYTRKLCFGRAQETVRLSRQPADRQLFLEKGVGMLESLKKLIEQIRKALGL